MPFFQYMYMPSLTLPSPVFTPPVVALFVLGPVVGYAIQRMCAPISPRTPRPIADIHTAEAVKQDYAAIRKTPLSPPAWVFGPVWTILHGTMGYAAHRATTSGLAHPDPLIHYLALAGKYVYNCQLGLNVVCMPLFFGLRRPAFAFLDIVSLIINAGTLVFLWSRWDITAMYLVMPYLAWLGFTAYLTAGTGVLNGWNSSNVENKN